MGCFHSSLHQIEYIFNANDILYLTQSWNIVKTHDLQKFGQDVLIESMNQSPFLRQFWTSKIQVDGNNYDFSQSESCLRTDLSWHIGLRDYSIQFISIFEQLLSVINDENRLKSKLQSIDLPENFFPIEYESLLIMKQSILEILRKRFTMFHYDYTNDHQRVWNKFLTFIIEYLMKKENAIRRPTEILISPATNDEQSSSN